MTHYVFYGDNKDNSTHGTAVVGSAMGAPLAASGKYAVDEATGEWGHVIWHLRRMHASILGCMGMLCERPTVMGSKLGALSCSPLICPGTANEGGGLHCHAMPSAGVAPGAKVAFFDIEIDSDEGPVVSSQACSHALAWPAGTWDHAAVDVPQ